MFSQPSQPSCAAYAAQEERAVRSRNFRNRLIRIAGLLALLLLTMLVVAWRNTGSIPVCTDACPRPEGAGLKEVVLVVLLGMLGASLHIVGRLQKMGGSWNAYNLPCRSACREAAGLEPGPG